MFARPLPFALPKAIIVVVVVVVKGGLGKMSVLYDELERTYAYRVIRFVRN